MYEESMAIALSLSDRGIKLHQYFLPKVFNQIFGFFVHKHMDFA